MKVTDKVKIGGQTYDIKLLPQCTTENRMCDGQILYDKGIVELRNDLQGEYKEYVFTHEIIHGIFEFCGLEQDENMVDRIARALHMVIKDNPDIFKEGDINV
jgi:hypothetical protein